MAMVARQAVQSIEELKRDIRIVVGETPIRRMRKWQRRSRVERVLHGQKWVSRGNGLGQARFTMKAVCTAIEQIFMTWATSSFFSFVVGLLFAKLNLKQNGSFILAHPVCEIVKLHK